ncbi:Y4yA family PLP-dependent enzyme [Streptomyces caniscabiei]|uniref:Y4yA family PLP-dependent enzyme n=1 Tax=Streptomyces caniscabiei TaxID=2746961 RepID=A0A927QID6_9ACTN|nr:Y4yA family PLP-dependent enzyme [Streptomyces caniscabiei]MBD9726870.1 Y4yA family PLP-dependent enzyme [Streptomyces caniscabiei]MDX3513731.1 Y4yA family PLP-dependent enzyme [Streptomyces caniscabiei]MDX3722578.1 Y4yA family PLP-dependent enzyme [Streptomyces caniscabiei]WEO23290.1 Y4yA family PLP-dependent enzyme [Streptomyces caniscabiei]
MSDDPLYLEPRLAPPTAALLESAPLLHTLVDALGSPLNIVLPDRIADNLRQFRSVFDRHRLGGQIYFAHKANRSSSLVRRLTTTDASLDAASLRELQHALGSGFAGDRIMATGPKDPDFLWLTARTGAVLNVDGPEELRQAADLVRTHELPPLRVLLRLSGFEAAGATRLSRRSRFGTSVKSLHLLLDILERHRQVLEPIGVGYHLDTTSLDEKAAALDGCLRAMEELRIRGFQPRAVDVGGGFGIDYLAHAAQWERYTTELTAAVMGSRPPLTWGGHGYGLRAENGTLRGALSLYPAHRPVAGAAYLDALLSYPSPSLGRPLGVLLLESLYDLYVEPGRALVDQCGLTLGRVLEVRPTDTGPYLVRLAMNAGDVGLEDHGVLLDPLVLPRDPTDSGDAPMGSGGTPMGSGDTPSGSGDDTTGAVAVHLMGNLCLEADLITRRTVFLPRLPHPGDLLAFVNTAGYCMDFGATHAQQQPVARKVAVHRQGGRWRWCLDEEYWPLDRTGGPQG